MFLHSPHTGTASTYFWTMSHALCRRTFRLVYRVNVEIFPRHLAGFTVHVDGDDEPLIQAETLQKNHVFSQSGCQEALAGAGGTGQDDASVFL